MRREGSRVSCGLLRQVGFFRRSDGFDLPTQDGDDRVADHVGECLIVPGRKPRAGDDDLDVAASDDDAAAESDVPRFERIWLVPDGLVAVEACAETDAGLGLGEVVVPLLPGRRLSEVVLGEENPTRTSTGILDADDDSQRRTRGSRGREVRLDRRCDQTDRLQGNLSGKNSHDRLPFQPFYPAGRDLVVGPLAELAVVFHRIPELCRDDSRCRIFPSGIGFHQNQNRHVAPEICPDLGGG